MELPEKIEREITEALPPQLLKRTEAEEAELRWNFNKRRSESSTMTVALGL